MTLQDAFVRVQTIMQAANGLSPHDAAHYFDQRSNLALRLDRDAGKLVEQACDAGEPFALLGRTVWALASEELERRKGGRGG